MGLVGLRHRVRMFAVIPGGGELREFRDDREGRTANRSRLDPGLHRPRSSGHGHAKLLSRAYAGAAGRASARQRWARRRSQLAIRFRGLPFHVLLCALASPSWGIALGLVRPWPPCTPAEPGPLPRPRHSTHEETARARAFGRIHEADQPLAIPALGHQPTLASRLVMSALPSIADIRQVSVNVR